jgi:hypothetical protein
LALAHAALGGAVTSDAVVRVAVVIDLGVHSGMSPRVFIKCLKVPASTNGSDVLASVARSFRIPAPTYASSGLLCSIDGYPSMGCGTSERGGYAYWSYWHGGSQWSYASIGPAAWTTRDADVEGWRYQNPGAANPSDPPPDASPAFATACAAAATSPAPTPTNGSGSAGSTTLFVSTSLIVVALGAAGTLRWRRRTGT